MNGPTSTSSSLALLETEIGPTSTESPSPPRLRLTNGRSSLSSPNGLPSNPFAKISPRGIEVSTGVSSRSRESDFPVSLDTSSLSALSPRNGIPSVVTGPRIFPVTGPIGVSKVVVTSPRTTAPIVRLVPLIGRVTESFFVETLTSPKSRLVDGLTRTAGPRATGPLILGAIW